MNLIKFIFILLFIDLCKGWGYGKTNYTDECRKRILEDICLSSCYCVWCSYDIELNLPSIEIKDSNNETNLEKINITDSNNGFCQTDILPKCNGTLLFFDQKKVSGIPCAKFTDKDQMAVIFIIIVLIFFGCFLFGCCKRLKLKQFWYHCLMCLCCPCCKKKRDKYKRLYMEQKTRNQFGDYVGINGEEVDPNIIELNLNNLDSTLSLTNINRREGKEEIKP